jgi:hypothetical protein
VLRESGYGTLADEWQDSCSAFETCVAGQQGPLSNDGLKAYAKMKMCWYKIQQLRDAAVQLLERRPPA